MVTQIPSTKGMINIEELTNERDKGAFDELLKTLQRHLELEFTNGRIRGTDYANAYIALMQVSLPHAINFTLEKAKQPLELQQLEVNIQKTASEIALITKQGALVDAQADTEAAKTNQLNYETFVKMPVELELLKREIAIKEAQIPIMYEELKLKQAELELKLLQIPLMKKELELKEAQLQVALQELKLKAVELAMRKYELEHKLPCEVRLVCSQADLYRQKVTTEKAQTDNSVVGSNSTIALNNNLLKEQAKTYQWDASLKYANMLIDTWKTRYAYDPDATPIDTGNLLQDNNIGASVRYAGNAIGINI